MAVRYDKNFMSEINKVIRAYNSKIRRLSKMDTNYILPKKFTTKSLRDLKSTSLTRKEVRRKLRDLQTFTKRGGEKLVKVGTKFLPKYQYDNIKRYRRLLKYRTTKKLKKYEETHPIANNKVQPFTFAQYGSQDYLTLKAKRAKLIEEADIEAMSEEELKTYFYKLRANTREYDLDLWQNNYIDILQDTALSYGYDDEKLEVIVERLRKLTPEAFDELSFVNRNIKEILTSYKALLNINTAKELSDDSIDVINNLDSIYENLDEILSQYE